MFSVSGYLSVSHLGGVTEGVHMMTAMPASYNASVTSLSQSKVNFPSSGSMRLHANSPMRTQLMPTSFMRSISGATSEAGHISG